ncbi:MAG: efflux RND transporter periplasmic adaptor subunit [Planctomycetes bacterium]|nr:efflux RND transporter periplasmic adaptor subunit [Planctomycetota bacterium]
MTTSVCETEVGRPAVPSRQAGGGGTALAGPDAPMRRAGREVAPSEAASLQLAALTELLGRLQTSPTAAEACHVLADEMQTWLGCQEVVVGLCRPGSTTCRVEAISQVDAFPAHGQKARAAQAVLQEAIARSDVSCWPARDEGSRHALKAHEQYASSCPAEVVVSSPLRDARGDVRGAWLFAGRAAVVSSDSTMSLIAAAQSPVACVLQLLARAQAGRVRGVVHAAARAIRRRRGQVVLAALALVVGLLWVPVPHRVPCDCQLEPVTRRFVAAPFAGPLRETCVEPGDVVRQGQLLARMDGREIRWELAGVQADLYRATKARAGHVASHKAGEAEVARHEVDRLRFREELLKSRDQELEIRSPVDGMIVSGDLKDAQGMPLKVGEVLFEVAPLDAMVVELAVPEDDVKFVETGMPVAMSLDAFPTRRFSAQVGRVHPRAELRDGENVFVAEVILESERGELLPGMRGHGRVAVGNARLGWILFRRPVAAALEWLGW